jgi:hypothetical protein
MKLKLPGWLLGLVKSLHLIITINYLVYGPEIVAKMSHHFVLW